ncbi:2OG-Fe(II) oxygenase [Oceanibaculum nanhaiense]|uniref:2OG-Fe(II) oxygenase n=1 Tax=Oceanibaculum nanhaiense TaxID=1909734 RepID=UPI00396DCC48
MLAPGDPVPWFFCDSTVNPRFFFPSVADKPVALFFFGSLSTPAMAQLWDEYLAAQLRFMERGFRVVGVSVDPRDRQQSRLIDAKRSFVTLWDAEMKISGLFGVATRQGGPGAAPGTTMPSWTYAPAVCLLDENLRVIDWVALGDPATHVTRALARIDAMPARPAPRLIEQCAPVLQIPNVLDRQLCQQLIEAWETEGNTESGYMERDAKGKLVGYIDHSRKRRRDHFLPPKSPLYETLSHLAMRRIIPAVARAYHYEITRVERFCIACYDGENGGGYFKAHRDFTGAESHRAFAMTINLNTEQYEGGHLVFPEFGPHLYRPETGGAVLFSGYLMHEVQPVTRGRRFALLSFFYGEREARVREQYAQTHGIEHETRHGTPEYERLKAIAQSG